MSQQNDTTTTQMKTEGEKRCSNCGKTTGAAASFSEGSEKYLRVSINGPTSPMANPDEKGPVTPDGEHSLMGQSTTKYYCSEECAAEDLSDS